MNRLLISDLHLDLNPLNSYRWDALEQVYNIVKDCKITHVYILGDLTDKKDLHSSILVNEVVVFIKKIAIHAEVFILKGNHDYISKDHPFFEFLGHLSNVTYIKEIQDINDDLFIPYMTSYIDLDNIDASKYQNIYMHCDLIGAKVSNLYSMEKGLHKTNKFFKQFKGDSIYSGHIHIPQDILITQDCIFTYIGSPYHINFGDNFRGRVILPDSNKDIEIISIAKHKLVIKTIEDLGKYELKEKDQCKIKIITRRSDLGTFDKFSANLRKTLQKMNVQVISIDLELEEEIEQLKQVEAKLQDSDTQVIEKFAKKEKLTQTYLNIGLEITNVTDSGVKNTRI